MPTYDDPEKEVTIIHEQNSRILYITLIISRKKLKMQEDAPRKGRDIESVERSFWLF